MNDEDEVGFRTGKGGMVREEDEVHALRDFIQPNASCGEVTC